MSVVEQWPYFAVPLVVVIAVHSFIRWRTDRLSRARLSEARQTGMDEPVSLHPRIDVLACIGCSACVKACPEGDVLGLIGGKASLIAAAECIGHGACRAACPVNAITLVIGTERRGVDLPHVGPDFQTNVPGLYVAGELGGMGLIRNAIEQGRQAVEAAAKRLRAQDKARGADLRRDADLVIVGAGPAGLAAGLTAKSLGLSVIMVEQEALGGTVAHYPRHKLVMTEPAELPGHGRVRFTRIGKEELLEFWAGVTAKAALKVDYGEEVLAVAPAGQGLEVRTARRTLKAGAVVLCVGRRGTPRRLGAPGEDLPKVVYRLIDPAQYSGQKVLVVGGGDSALEAACALSELAGTEVTLAYRGEAFSRAKSRNRQRIAEAQAAGAVRVLLSAEIGCIAPDEVQVMAGGEPHHLANDAVIVCAGGVLPSEFLRAAGVKITTHHGREMGTAS